MFILKEADSSFLWMPDYCLKTGFNEKIYPLTQKHDVVVDAFIKYRHFSHYSYELT